MNQIILKNIQKSFNQSSVLRSINYTFNKGESYGIMGVSGTGKSTLLHIIAGLDCPSTGSIIFDALESSALTKEHKEHILHQHIGMVFQTPYLIKELSVLENVLIKGLLAKTFDHTLEDNAKVLLDHLGLKDKMHHAPASLSGGQQQRVALARALINKPTFLIADEPTAHVDPATKQELIEFIGYYQRTYHMGVIISSHDPAIIQTMNHTLTLEQGSLL